MVNMSQYKKSTRPSRGRGLNSFDDIVGIVGDSNNHLDFIAEKWQIQNFKDWVDDKYASTKSKISGARIEDLIASSEIWGKYESFNLLKPQDIDEMIRDLLASDDYFNVLFNDGVTNNKSEIKLSGYKFIQDPNGNVNIFYDEMKKVRKKNNDRTKGRYTDETVHIKRNIRVPSFGFYNSSGKVPFFAYTRTLNLDDIDMELKKTFDIVDKIFPQRNAQALLFSYFGGKEVPQLNNLSKGYSSRIHKMEMSSYLISNKRFNLVKKPRIDRKALNKTMSYYYDRGGQGVNNG